MMKGCVLDKEPVLRVECERSGQAHLLTWWPELSSFERQRLLEQIDSIDFALLQRLVQTMLRSRESSRPGPLEPAPIIALPSSAREVEERQAARELGEAVLGRGRVAALVAAGGQGTRLGFSGPKGAFPIGPISGKPLFSLFAERILAARRRYGVSVPWYVMTSPATDAETKSFFEKRGFFGLPQHDVVFFQQGTLPAMDRDGRILMAGKAEIAMSPDGHGGTLKALDRSGCLDDLEQRGIEEVSYFQVDNVLVKPLDPVFIGCHCRAGAEMSSKVVRKAYPEEKVGVLGMRNGKLSVIEYSDLGWEDMRAIGPDGELKYWAGSIAVHMIQVAFLRRLKEEKIELPFHRAEKKVPCIDPHGRPIEPDEPNGIKFESFIFDALGHVRTSVAFEVLRREEFSPVKNAHGVDSPETARRDLMELFASWLEDAGVAVPRNQEGSLGVRIEISPLVALDREEALAKIQPGLATEGDIHLR
jgi:UDP-N-acetylglucosamine/UDP-N-acetylgalactosamine diphosphorylase